MTSRPHDALFKTGFEDPSQIGALYRGSYPPALCDRIDWSSVRPELPSFVDDYLDDGHTDLLFSAQMRASSENAKPRRIHLYLLLEGRLEGRLEGQLEGSLNLLKKLLTLKFGELSEEHRERLDGATEGQLDACVERVLTADDIETVLAPLSDP